MYNHGLALQELATRAGGAPPRHFSLLTQACPLPLPRPPPPPPPPPALPLAPPPFLVFLGKRSEHFHWESHLKGSRGWNEPKSVQLYGPA